MARGLFSKKHKWGMVINIFMIIIIMTGGYGCAPIPQSQMPCLPDSPEANIYKAPLDSWLANTIFEYAYPLVPTPTSPDEVTSNPFIQPSDQQMLGARYEAFQLLIKQTKRWSTIETLKLDDTNEMQFIVTFISPELVQAVFLNEVLKDRYITSDFQVHLQNVLNSIATRDELLFLVTVTATGNNNISFTPYVIEIPITQMVLKNAGNLESAPVHEDHNLEQPINSSFAPVFGYIAYPFGMLSSNGCDWILDPKYNTNIVITVPDIKKDNVSSRKYTWTIPYKSLIDTENPSTQPLFIVPPDFKLDLVTPLPRPPYPMANLMSPNGINPDMYWQDFARYVWSQITLGNY